jgi:hypothetical protein
MHAAQVLTAMERSGVSALYALSTSQSGADSSFLQLFPNIKTLNLSISLIATILSTR